jgi:hypothetical protein
MGMTYNELSIYGRMRKVDKLGPYGMWSKLLHQWGDKLSPQEIFSKVRWFLYVLFIFLSLNITIRLIHSLAGTTASTATR